MKKKKSTAAVLLFCLCALTACGMDSAQSQLYEENIEIQTEDTKAGTKEFLQVHFMDVGQGDATLITCNGESMLIDAGDNSKGTTVQQYLLKQNIDKLDYVIGTHPDADHVGGLDVIISKFDCEKIFLTGEERDTDTYRDVLSAMDYRNYEMVVPNAGEEYTLGDATFTIEGPLMLGSDSNENSIVIHLEHGENSFLLVGDAGEEEEKDILSTGRNIQADVYKVGHHGSKTSTSAEFLEAVQPEYAVISVGEDNRYGHPSAEVLNQLRAQDIEVFRTDEQGSIVAKSDGKNITFNCSPSESWQAGEPKGSTQEDTADNAVVHTSGMVYITESGSKYHTEGCKHLEKSKIAIDIEEAKALGYEACRVCGGE
ncbi:MAG: MBL fold metallo-hydrolase [Lachnospiraceae bacterium]|nr:MBL fold metallo-hydrolase [Lachnospiraceae bacterium]